MKAFNQTIFSKCFPTKVFKKSLNLFKNQNRTFIINNRISYNSNILLVKNQRFCFAENNNNDEDTHSDFKPKSKVEITDDNVMQMIDDWIKNNDVVLFMKGTREMPRCGFSNYAIQIIKFYNIKEVKIINILENPIVREAVKKYSNWPTYPQLYVKGNLIGNLNFSIYN